MDKAYLVDQLAQQLKNSVRIALEAGNAAAEEARDGATAAEKREDARVAIEFAGLAKGQKERAKRAQDQLSMIELFRPGKFAARAPIAIGAIVEIEDPDEGEGRTFFLAPAGAGITLTGPGGDGYLSVVTPVSPIGKAVLGRRVGDIIDVTVAGDLREWTITYVG